VTQSEPPPHDQTFSHVPDNVRAEIARRRMHADKVAAQIPMPNGGVMSYATFKRRMRSPGTFTLDEVEALARILRVPVERLTRPVNGDVEVRP
jgi:hypothetical protein